MKKELAKKYIDIFNDGLKEVEKHLNKEQFEEYCDNNATITAYWNKVKNKLE